MRRCGRGLRDIRCAVESQARADSRCESVRPAASKMTFQGRRTYIILHYVTDNLARCRWVDQPPLSLNIARACEYFVWRWRQACLGARPVIGANITSLRLSHMNA